MKIKTTKKKKSVYRAVPSSTVRKRTTSPRAERAPRERRERSGGISVGMIFVIFLCVCLVGGMIGFGVVISEISGNKNATFATSTEIEIPEGSSTEAIGDILKSNEMIGSVNIFKIYCRVKGIDGTFQPGPHLFDQRMSYADVVSELQTVVIAPRETFEVTFPEGTTVVKMGMILADKEVCTVQEFVTEAQTGEFTNEFLKEIPDDPNIFVRLEGYLYPETYQFYKDDTPHEWIQTMLDTFEERILTDERKAAIEQNELSLHQIITFASIVQKEYSDAAHNQRDIAKVFWNRYNDPVDYAYWGSCVSGWYDDSGRHEGYINNCMMFYNSQYLGKSTPESMQMAYDTYRGVQGLPIGPMYNMKEDIVDAVLNPSDVDYTFFCNDKYGNTYWSYDYNTHANVNIPVYTAMDVQFAAGVSENQARINTGYNFDNLVMTDSPLHED